MISSRCDEVTKGFSFSGNISEVFYVLRDRDFGDGIFVDMVMEGREQTPIRVQ